MSRLRRGDSSGVVAESLISGSVAGRRRFGDWSANWSPDGSRIAFQSTRDGLGANPGADNFEIYTMNSDGSEVVRLTTNDADDPATPINEATDGDPAFSPDGTKIVFESNRTGDTEVHTMNADGSDVTRLTNSAGFDGRCDWQPISPKGVPPVGDPPRPPVDGGSPTVARVRPNLFRPGGSARSLGARSWSRFAAGWPAIRVALVRVG